MVKEKEKFEREKYETNCIKKCSDDVNVNRNRMDKFEYNGNLYNETETCTTSKFPLELLNEDSFSKFECPTVVPYGSGSSSLGKGSKKICEELKSKTEDTFDELKYTKSNTNKIRNPEPLPPSHTQTSLINKNSFSKNYPISNTEPNEPNQDLKIELPSPTNKRLDRAERLKQQSSHGPYIKGNWRTLNIKSIIPDHILSSNDANEIIIQGDLFKYANNALSIKYVILTKSDLK